MQPKRILVPIDFSDACRSALKEADELATSAATLTLLHVYEPTQVAIMDFAYVEPPENVSQVLASAEAQLREWADGLQTPPERRSVKALTGTPVHVIIEESQKHDLIVMPTHARSRLGRFLLGSVAERVVKGAACSVLIVKNFK